MSYLDRSLVLDEFVTSLYCEDDLDEHAFEVGVEAIRAVRAVVTQETSAEEVYSALEGVVEARAGDGRFRGARQLRAAMVAAATALPRPLPTLSPRQTLAMWNIAARSRPRDGWVVEDVWLITTGRSAVADSECFLNHRTARSLERKGLIEVRDDGHEWSVAAITVEGVRWLTRHALGFATRDGWVSPLTDLGRQVVAQQGR